MARKKYRAYTKLKKQSERPIALPYMPAHVTVEQIKIAVSVLSQQICEKKQ